MAAVSTSVDGNVKYVLLAEKWCEIALTFALARPARKQVRSALRTARTDIFGFVQKMF